MTMDAAGQPATELVDTVVALYGELAEVTAAFLEAVQDGPPEEEAQSLFWQARTELVGRLQPLLAQEEHWLGHSDGRQQKEQRQHSLALQLEKMQLVADLDARIVARLVALQAQVGEELKSLGQGKKRLVGYRVGLKGAPRFCQRTA
ncbi:hypothetical protein [Thiovibrio frasassiensis]|uniref:Uncharacterized protein n=1 Tax=Thiovibrio frasassiensis TaxID=2984131 RepID=A0A9X4RL74_9BACT|nr:hypothetical protein [Thiovibrio frasassiensis]MDG4474788.1 hypothetical protein [Thiovibrio frasassiensis]